ncbi:hypothetical protein [Leptolyngbya sp. NIES-2104]|uniref:hypothetical protein n=1 Tax=Leptolyngbya sp. NIES-2104 TaxID=1552121 RepID=UPI0006EC8510|nr:hypothetical protein [Leptolyngbya sp. NIES-2104]GAP98906.1 hypothetical protein NIES2104_54620 [Leptolyngbya sp. NIES-2104]
MNQKLVESLAQIILSLSDEERQFLEKKIQRPSIAKEKQSLEERLKKFEEAYQMPSEQFYQKFQAGELGDSIDFFEWNTYYEMYNSAQLKAS